MPPNDEETPPGTSQDQRVSTLMSDSGGKSNLRLNTQGSSLTKHKVINRMKAWMQQYKDATFTYAGYLKPGKHQMIVYDELNDAMWFKDILADQRGVEIKKSKYYLTN